MARPPLIAATPQSSSSRCSDVRPVLTGTRRILGRSTPAAASGDERPSGLDRPVAASYSPKDGRRRSYSGNEGRAARLPFRADDCVDGCAYPLCASRGSTSALRDAWSGPEASAQKPGVMATGCWTSRVYSQSVSDAISRVGLAIGSSAGSRREVDLYAPYSGGPEMLRLADTEPGVA